jgi:group I intron endonuclease
MIIYQTTNLLNGKIYVGQDAKDNPNYYGSGIILERSIKKYGISNFKKDIIERCKSKKELDIREKYWIKKLNATDKSIGYNISLGGDGGDIYSQLSPKRQKEMIDKRLAKRIEWDTPAFRKKKSEQTKKMWESEKHKSHMRKVMTGREITWKNKIGKSNKKFWELYGDVRTEESKVSANKKSALTRTGLEIKSIPVELYGRIIELYQTVGAKLIEKELQSEGYDVSRYLIVKFLKRIGIYQKWQKGIGEKSSKKASISKCGDNNPMRKSS